MIENFSKKILLVDDSRIQLMIMEEALSQHGYQCIKANSGSEALSLLQKEQPDVILSDVEMPGMSGFDFKEKLMNTPSLKNIPFLFLTSYSDREVMMQGLDLKAIDYIVKGTPIPVIISKLNNLLQTVKQQHSLSIEELKKAAESLNIKSIPERAPVIEGFQVDFWHRAFENYPGGDFIDFIKVDERYTFIIMGDIMGKKWKAWFFTFCFLSYIRSAVRFCIYDNNTSTAVILQKINMLVSLDNALENILSSLSLLMIDRKENKVVYSGAGDLPVLLYTAKTGEFTKLQSGGLLLGLQSEGLYDETTIDMNSGDQLLLFTDGIIDYCDQIHHKSNYNAFTESVSPVLGKANSFDLVKKLVSFTQPGRAQLDDASMIFIQKD